MKRPAAQLTNGASAARDAYARLPVDVGTCGAVRITRIPQGERLAGVSARRGTYCKHVTNTNRRQYRRAIWGTWVVRLVPRFRAATRPTITTDAAVRIHNTIRRHTVATLANRLRLITPQCDHSHSQEKCRFHVMLPFAGTKKDRFQKSHDESSMSTLRHSKTRHGPCASEIFRDIPYMDTLVHVHAIGRYLKRSYGKTKNVTKGRIQ